MRTIILEEMLLDNDGPASTEYKFHVCNGTTAYVFVQQRLISGGTTHFFADRDGRYVKAHPTDADQIRPLPTYFLEMRDVAEQLAEPFDFIRCDLYDLSGEFAFSELTVYPQSGTGNDGVRSLAELRNSSWDLRKSWLLTREQSGWRKRYATALVRWIERHATASSA